MSLKKIYVDIESYYDSKSYTLRELSMTEYLRDKRFKLLGCGYYIQLDNGEWEYGYVRPEDMKEFAALDWKNYCMVAHNCKYDSAALKWHYGIEAGQYFDTMSLARAVLGQNVSSHSLKVVSDYLGLPPKGELETDGLQSLTPEQEQKMMVYNRRDLECCAGIDEKLGPQFPQSQLKAMDWTIRTFINPTLELDVPLLEKMVLEEQKRKEGIFKDIMRTEYASIEAIAKKEQKKKDGPFVLSLESTEGVFSSNKKFAELLTVKGVAVPTKESPSDPEKRIPAFSLGDAGFVALQSVCPELYEARVAAKSTITEARGENLAAIGRSGKFPFDVQFSGAVQTHRYSGGSGGGGNPQNFPKKGDMRKAVCAPKNNALVVGDFSAIEARIVAWIAKEPTLIDKFSNDEDVYCGFASMIYGKVITKKDVSQRMFGKSSILGLGYGMGWEKFQKKVKQDCGIEIDEKEAKRVVYLYRGVYSAIPTLWENISSLLPQMADGYDGIVPFAPFLRIGKNCIVLPSGLKLQYPNLRYESSFENGEERKEWIYDVYVRKYDSTPARLYGGKLLENISQALAGEINKLAIDRCIEDGLNVVGSVHDELLAVTLEDQVNVDYAVDRMTRSMKLSPSWWSAIKLNAEVHAGPNWKAAK